ncbi:hypothetical protein [Brevibacillus agri]|uniref:hypothetical protein n=1 Tax=Brevibacillus agri TaxID=51101 RepID=UPI002E1E96B1|nr:hypothetical protein [Brevibacillus agri]
MIDFTLYPKTAELIDETSMNDQADQIIFLQKNREEAAVLLAEMHLMALAGISDSIPLRNRSKNESNYFYEEVNNSVHVFAQEQALYDFGLSFDEKFRYFKHKNPFLFESN